MLSWGRYYCQLITFLLRLGLDWTGLVWLVVVIAVHRNPFTFTAIAIDAAPFSWVFNQCPMPNPTNITVGVLALQGAFLEHLNLLRRAATQLQSQSASTSQDELQFDLIQVRNVAQLSKCDALIIPGGESTTMSLVAAQSGLLEPLREFVKYVPSFSLLLCDQPLTNKIKSPSKTDLGYMCRSHSPCRGSKRDQEGRSGTHWWT